MKEKFGSNIEWIRWGKTDPLMGVATRTGKEKSGSDPWTNHEFYDLGKYDWDDYYRVWERYGVDSKSCIEIGCGAGRYTKQLEKCFKTVFAQDISQEMIEYAKDHISGGNIEYLLSDGANIDLKDNSVSSAFSAHVFQHFDSVKHANKYFRELDRVLTPGGTIMIHLPIHQWPNMPTLFGMIYGIIKFGGDVRAWMKRLLLVKFGLFSNNFMRGNSYSIEYIFDYLDSIGFKDIEIVLIATSKEKIIHPFILARKK